MAPNKMYDQIPRHRQEILRARYDIFMENLNDTSKEVVKIFDTLGPKQQEELELIREVSRELQTKKEEDMRKAAQAAEEAAKEAEAKEAEAKAELEKKQAAAEEAKANEAETKTTDEEVEKVEKEN